VFHVSPFCEVQGGYRFRFMRTADRTVARIDHDDADGPLLQTSVSGRCSRSPPPACARLLRHAADDAGRDRPHPLAGAALWLKRVPFFRKPEPPHRSSPADPRRHPPSAHEMTDSFPPPATATARPACPPAPAAARAVLRLLQRLRHGTLDVQLPDGSRRASAPRREGTRGGDAPAQLERLRAALKSGDIGFAEATSPATGPRPTWSRC
jgi:hypothetical protein